MDPNDKTPGSTLDNAIDKAKEGMDNVREKIHDATKLEEQKEAEKSTTDKIADALPNSAKEAGSQLGGAVDAGVQKAKDALSGNSNDKK